MADRWAKIVIAVLVGLSILMVSLVVYDANRARPVNTVNVSNVRVTEDAVLADITAFNRTLITPSTQSQIIDKSNSNVVWRFMRGQPAKTKLGITQFLNLAIVDLNEIRLAPGCYIKTWSSTLVYPTWFSEKFEVYTYESPEFCIEGNNE